MAILFVFIDDDNAKIKLIRLFAWIFLLFLVLAFFFNFCVETIKYTRATKNYIGQIVSMY